MLIRAIRATGGCGAVPPAPEVLASQSPFRARLPIQSQARNSEIDRPVVQPVAQPLVPIRLGDLRPAPAGLPEADIAPPVVAESDDPFTALRVAHIVARVPRGVPIALTSVVDRLNATHLDWLFSERVVADAILQLQANWAADYRSTGGIVLEDGLLGATVTVEDTSRVDPWIVRQAQRHAAACREALVDFSRRERATGHD